MASQIKGLSQFIADVRTTSTPEAERARVQAELAALRRKIAATRGGKEIAGKNKAGYEYRKVVSKLLYIYILGYDVDLGRDEVNALLQMPKFAEKQIGYLALGLLLHARADLQDEIEALVEADLRSPKEVLTSLALNYVSTFDLRVQPASPRLVDLVYQLMASPTSSAAVAKKAALTYLNFYRQDPARFAAEPDWPDRVERITALLVDPQRGVAVAMAPLLLEIARTSPASVPPSVARAVVRKLDDAFEAGGDDVEGGDEYSYYHMSAPWLVAKLCQLLSHLPLDAPDLVEEARATVAGILAFCIDDIEEAGESIGPSTPKADASGAAAPLTSEVSQQHRNARNLVFVDALRLANAMHIEQWDLDTTLAALQIVKSQFASRDANVRYLALEAIQHFATPLPAVPHRPERRVSMRELQRQRTHEAPVTPQLMQPPTFATPSGQSIASSSAVSPGSPHGPPGVRALGGATDMDVVRSVLSLVKDRDISVRQQALDALYKLVDKHTVEQAAAELLDMLVSTDLQIRPQMVSRLAALIERFATSHAWYFDTSISLLLLGGVYASDQVWQRLAQVVVNNQALHEYAVMRIRETLQADRDAPVTPLTPGTPGGTPGTPLTTRSAPIARNLAGQPLTGANSDAVVKLSAFVLGEFADAHVARGGDPLDLFLVLQDQVGAATWSTRAVLLSAYAKFAARFPTTRGAVHDALALYLNVHDAETQQRATEYLALLRPENAALLAALAQPMPPFSSETSTLLFQQLGQTERQVPGQAHHFALGASTALANSLPEVPVQAPAVSNGSATAQARRSLQAPLATTTTGQPAGQEPIGPGGLLNQPTGFGPLLGAPMAPMAPQMGQMAPPSMLPTPMLPTPTGLRSQPTGLRSQSTGPAMLQPTPTGGSTHLSSNWEFGFRRMLTHSEAVLYQDALLQVGCRYDFHGARGTVRLLVTNRSDFEIKSLALAIHNPMSDETLSVHGTFPHTASVAAGRTVEAVIACEAKQPFALSPTARITYFAGTLGEVAIRLPIVLERFMAPSHVTAEQFAQRWTQVSAEFEFTKTARNFSHSRAAPASESARDVLAGMQYGVVALPHDGVWAPASVAGAGIIHTATGGMFGCLVVVQPEGDGYLIKVRSTRKKLTAVVLANNIAMAYQL